MPRPRRILGTLLPLAVCAGVPAAAFNRSGAVKVLYDEISVRSRSGSTQRSYFSRGANLDLSGTLVNRAIGTFASSAEYSDGASVDTAVNSESPEQRVFAANASAELLGAKVRNFITFDPNWSVQSMRLRGGPGVPEHTITNGGWGFRSGLTVWKLPGVSVSRQYNTLENPDGPVPSRQTTRLRGESLSKTIKGVRLRFTRDRRRTRDELSTFAAPEIATERGSLDYNKYEIKSLGLQSFSLTGNYQNLKSDGDSTQKYAAARLGVRSMPFGSSVWKHTINFSNDFRRDMLAAGSETFNNFQLASGRAIPRGTLTNSLSAHLSRSELGLGRGAGLSPVAVHEFAAGRVSTNLSGDLSVARSATGLSNMTDALGGRLTLKPRPVFDFYLDARTTGARSLSPGVPGDQRSRFYEVGTSRRSGVGESTFRYNRIERRDFASGSRSVNDQINLTGTAVPAARLNTEIGFNFSTTKTDSGKRYDSKNFRAGAVYRLLWGPRLNAFLTFSELQQYNATLTADYTLGKTNLKLALRHSELPSSSSFSHLSVSLTRSF